MMKTFSVLLLSLLPALPAAQAQADAGAGDSGVAVERMSPLRKLVPAEQLESMASQEYESLIGQAREKGVLADAQDPQLRRLHRIADQLIPHVSRWNERASNWQWEIGLIEMQQVNAFCLPGGKIAFFSGLLKQLQLTDDEIAIVMGHEIAHALREHGRERVAKGNLLNLGAALTSWIFDLGNLGQTVLGQGAQLTMLKFSRDDELEADLVGLDIVARAGFDPRAGIALWQKMALLNKQAPPQWLSTHPAGKNRIAEIGKQLPRVLPLYAQAKGRAVSELPPYRSNVSNIPPVR